MLHFAAAEIVQDRDGVSAVEEPTDKIGPDAACAARNDRSFSHPQEPHTFLTIGTPA